MLIDDIRKTYEQVLALRRTCNSVYDTDTLDNVARNLWRAQEQLALVEVKVKFPNWEYRTGAPDGRRPIYCLEEKAAMNDAYHAPYTILVKDNGKVLFYRTNTIEDALRFAEKQA